MTEKEKAAQGLLYNADYDPALVAEREKAAELCYDYNVLRPSQADEKDRILSALLGSRGKNCVIVPPLHCDYGYNIHVGENFFANYNFIVLDGGKVTIGDNVFIAPNVGIYTAGHPLDVERRNIPLEYAKPVRIGSDVWIGANVCILPGVEIGDGTTIAAGSVVAGSIPAGVLAAGNPCRVIRRITEQDKEKYKV